MQLGSSIEEQNNDNNNNNDNIGKKTEIIAMDISGSKNLNDILHKKSNSIGDNGMEERNKKVNKLIHRSKSNINMETSNLVMKPFGRTRSQSANSKDNIGTSGNYQASEEEMEQFINMKHNFNFNQENKVNSPLLSDNNSIDNKKNIDISTMKTPTMEDKMNAIKGYQTDLTKVDSPKNIINVTSNDQFINNNHSENSQPAKMDDISFPLPPQFNITSPKSQRINIIKNNEDLLHDKSASYSTGDYNDNSNNNSNKIKTGNYPNYINFDGTMKKVSEPMNINGKYGDLEFNRYNNQFKELNNPNLMDLKKKKLLNRNTIISTGEYMYEGKSSSLRSRFERERDLTVTKTGSEPLLY
eukprot:jgi/Orpsp1_1/1178456/evm.model.c7180000065373.1